MSEMSDSDEKKRIASQVQHYIWRSVYWHLNRDFLMEALAKCDNVGTVETLLEFSLGLQDQIEKLTDELRQMYEQARTFRVDAAPTIKEKVDG